MRLRSFSLYLFIVSLVSITACGDSQTESNELEAAATMSADTLGKHIAQLSSDDFLGRKPFTEGETKTINYLKEKYMEVGLEPGNGDSYFQEVPMVMISTTAAPTMDVVGPKGKFTLKGFDDYVIWTDKADSFVSFNNDELVFAGYGVVAPEYNWNDYEGLDVKGKIVLVLVNDPGFNAKDSSLFKGKTMTYYGRWTYKFEEAARQGAKGCLIVHSTEAASYPFSVVQNNWNGKKLRLDNRGKKETLCDVIGWVSGPTAQRLLEASGFTIKESSRGDSKFKGKSVLARSGKQQIALSGTDTLKVGEADTGLLASADKRGFKGRPLGLKLTTTMKINTTYNKSFNVIGKITGTKYPEETIVYTAHWDHLGIGKPDTSAKDDSIYNGALDNASATAGLIELARAFKALKTKPERTVIFLSVTAEEQGLWGSAYYAQNPVYPINKTLANINMDGLNWYGKTKDIVIVGKGQSNLEDYLKEEADKAGRDIAFELHPEAGSYYRSDHFNFAKVGVPALYTKSGTDIIGKGKEYGKQLSENYTSKNYHRPSDEYDPAVWNLEGAIEDLGLLFRVGKRLAFDTKWPEWKQGSEFKAIREKTLNP